MREAAEKIEQQALTLKGKYAARKRRGGVTRVAAAPEPAPEAAPVVRIIRASRYPVKPMSVEDAALQVESSRESFVVFRNADSEAVSIIYKRKDGHLGLIEPD